MSLSDYGEVQALTLLKANASYYLALFTAAPTDAGGGTEVTGGSYARVAVTFTTPTTTAGVTSMANSAELEFPTATASWGTVTHWGLYDASTGGNLVWWNSLSVSKALSANDTVLVHSGDLTITMD